jgi:hypothetical protein
MNYRAFLGREEERVLPYVGGATVRAPQRALRVEGSLETGWWRFRIRGRVASALEKTAPPDDQLAACPRVDGHVFGERLAANDARAEVLYLSPDDPPPLFSPCRARRWHGGVLLYEQLEFETDVEETARRAFEERGMLREVKGVPASLRAAFGYAMTDAAGREMKVAVSPAEVRAHVLEIAEGGLEIARREVRRLDEERRRFAQEAAVRAQAARTATATAAHTRASRRNTDDAEDRAARALSAAGAEMSACRALGGGLLEVHYRFEGERFVSVVAAATLQVMDAGICLDGFDDELTLDSLPGVIREGIEVGHLNITRR